MLRFRGKAVDERYKTWTLNPVIFCVFSASIIMRGVITDPLQGLAIFILAVVGSGVFRRVSAHELVWSR